MVQVANEALSSVTVSVHASWKDRYHRPADSTDAAYRTAFAMSSQPTSRAGRIMIKTAPAAENAITPGNSWGTWKGVSIQLAKSESHSTAPTMATPITTAARA